MSCKERGSKEGGWGIVIEHHVCGVKDLAEFSHGHWHEAVGWDCYGMWVTNRCSQHLRKGRPLSPSIQ